VGAQNFNFAPPQKCISERKFSDRKKISDNLKFRVELPFDFSATTSLLYLCTVTVGHKSASRDFPVSSPMSGPTYLTLYWRGHRNNVYYRRNNFPPSWYPQQLFNSFFPSPTQNFPFFNLWPSLVPRLTPAPQIRRVLADNIVRFINLFTYLLTYLFTTR